MSGPAPAPNQQVVPRPVRPLDERAFVSRGPIDDGPAEGLYAARCRGRDLRALARGGRVRPRRRRLDRRPVAAAVHDHPAAAEHHRLAPPRACPADRGRGPDDPPRPDARPSGALPARPRPRLDRRPVRARRHPRQGRGEPGDARPRALPRADARIRGHDSRGHALASSAGSARRPTGAACATRWTRDRPGPSASPSSASTGGPRLSHGSPGQLVPGLPDERQRPRGDRHAGDRDALVGALPPDRSGDRPSRRRTRPSRSPRPARRRSSGTPRWRSTRTTRATGPRRAPGAHPVRGSRRPDHRRRRRGPCLRDRRGQDHAGPRPRRPRDRPAPRPPRTDHPGRRRDDHRHRDALRRARPVRCARRHRGRPRGGRRPRGRRATRDGHRPLPAQQRHHRAAAQDAVVHPDDAARGTGARGDPQRTDPDPPRAIREDLGALADRHPRLERLAPAVVGPPHPGLVLPGWPRDRVVRARQVRTPAPSAGGPLPTSSRTPTSSTRGSARGCGRSRPSAGRTTRPTTGPTTRRRSWRPATTSSSSGSPG